MIPNILQIIIMRIHTTTLMSLHQCMDIMIPNILQIIMRIHTTTLMSLHQLMDFMMIPNILQIIIMRIHTTTLMSLHQFMAIMTLNILLIMIMRIHTTIILMGLLQVILMILCLKRKVPTSLHQQLMIPIMMTLKLNILKIMTQKNSYDNSHDSPSDEHDSHHDEEKHDGPPECLMSCEFGEDFHNDMCMWWEHQDPRHNPESCFDNCSPGIIFYFESNCEEPELNEEENEEDPFACAMDCPIEDLDPHSAESFCPWFSTHKATECFMDCSNDFLNMAQDHAEHTCAEFAQEDQFTSYIHYIEEPLIDILEEEKMKYEHSCPPGFMQNADICQVCPAATY